MSLINVGICKNLLGSLKRASAGLLELQNCQQVRWASKKQGGSTRNRGGSQPKMLGVKLYGGQACEAGNIIVRQRGTKLKPGAHVGMGRDHTIYALQAGRVVFSGQKKQKFVNVEPRQ